ncbi:MAG: hypothetical protein HFH68_08560 [Lachnospiraceae bacterium]|nr:hypothetical protein [Lachnospiraceae bacterium]
MKYTVRTQTYEITDCTLDNIKDSVDTMIHYEDEFVVLSASEEINGISFLQATMDNNDTVIFQAGVKINGKPEVMEKTVSKRDCYRMLKDYFLEGKTPGLTEFTMMKYM